MVLGLIQSVKTQLKYRGGWKGLFEHMYTNGDYPFKIGTYMGCDAAGNRYYENRVDYPFGQHRWVEPGDASNFDSTSIPPEWHGWMTSMNDVAPSTEEDYFKKMKEHTIQMCASHVPAQNQHNVGLEGEPLRNFHFMHNQTSIRSRGYGIGNPVVGLPPGAPDCYYTQPGSPYNESSRQKAEVLGQLDENRKYKSLKWRDRLMTAEEKQAKLDQVSVPTEEDQAKMVQHALKQIRRRGGGTILSGGK